MSTNGEPIDMHIIANLIARLARPQQTNNIDIAAQRRRCIREAMHTRLTWIPIKRDHAKPT
ncbi:hypothetical protein KSF_080570 [Reticulibacter mediterranei]|uniref:Uncharacterized protein n=1 Tax=Reticulibacter mediterranei TaxID=2778369 RepID=A0A8J3ILY4_9CHLR|nr:hypothetical protein KSF_080570 [Reticulibacter mediterranei]